MECSTEHVWPWLIPLGSDFLGKTLFLSFLKGSYAEYNYTWQFFKITSNMSHHPLCPVKFLLRNLWLILHRFSCMRLNFSYLIFTVLCIFWTLKNFSRICLRKHSPPSNLCGMFCVSYILMEISSWNLELFQLLFYLNEFSPFFPSFLPSGTHNMQTKLTPSYIPSFPSFPYFLLSPFLPFCFLYSLTTSLPLSLFLSSLLVPQIFFFCFTLAGLFQKICFKFRNSI